MSGDATVIVDNRLRQRWIDVAKAAGRRRFNRLAVILAIAAVVVIGLVIVESPLLDVDEIVVAGATHTSEEALLGAAGIAKGDALLTADLGAAERRLETLPWVAEASVSRSLPGQLKIEIIEREPATIITAGGDAALVDAGGRILETGSIAQLASRLSADHDAVLVDVPASSSAPVALEPGAELPTAASTAAGLAARVKDNPPGAVAAVVLDDQLTLTLHDGGSVVFGDSSNLDAKVEAFRTMFARVDLGCLDHIDLTVPTHPTLTRAASCS